MVTEIKAYATGAAALFPAASSVLDIGGQDTKVISMGPGGKVTDFEMNDKCAAGTGKFLEVMAKALGYSLEEMADRAMQAGRTVAISSMCTVFAESEVTGLVHRGEDRSAIARGLHESIAKRTVSSLKRVGAAGPLVFAGGVAKNPAMVAAHPRRVRRRGRRAGRGRNRLADRRRVRRGALRACRYPRSGSVTVVAGMIPMMKNFIADWRKYRGTLGKQDEWIRRYAAQHGYSVNPRWMVYTNLRLWLSDCEEMYGRRYCPCFEPTGEQAADRKLICPCAYLAEEVEQRGWCHCTLFGRADLSAADYKRAEDGLMDEYRNIPLTWVDGVLDTRGQHIDPLRGLPVPDAIHQVKRAIGGKGHAPLGDRRLACRGRSPGAAVRDARAVAAL